MKRRDFIEKTAAVATTFMIVPRHVLGGKGYTAPSEKLNIGGVGVGGVGKSYLENVASENIIALCDVDDEFAEKTYKIYPPARRYRDYREMLAKETELDAVVIGTPDHTHAIIAMDAMRQGKHIYCAKPLTRTIYESRLLTETARKTKVATQMSIQANAAEDHRLLCEWIADGAIGDVREVHVWSNRPIWPQGLDRPKEIPSVPRSLDWGLWIGPAPYRPYHPAYHPFKFRGWWDFGTGALGDMGCHQFDPIVKALKLGQPTSVHASSTQVYEDTFPAAAIVYYEFPPREGMPAVQVTWYDGGLKPRRPQELEEGRQFGDWNGGILFIGEKGTILSTAVGHGPRIIPETRMKAYKRPHETLPRSIGHYEEWIAACKGGAPAAANFDYGGPLTEMVLLGNIALRADKKLAWDFANMKITNDETANKYINEPYFNGWQI